VTLAVTGILDLACFLQDRVLPTAGLSLPSSARIKGSPRARRQAQQLSVSLVGITYLAVNLATGGNKARRCHIQQRPGGQIAPLSVQYKSIRPGE